MHSKKLNIETSKLLPPHSSFHGIVLGRRVMPLSTITLSVTSCDQVHYRKETLSFEVVDFEGPYHAILGRPYYAKFKAILSYAYLELKMPGPHGVITVTGSFQDAYECERLAVEQAQQDLILDESNHAYEDKQETGSGMPQCSPRSPEHWLMLETPARVLPPDSTVFASPATSEPPEAPDLPEEAKPEEEKNDPVAKGDPVTRA
jgi:hypothetical protein